MLTQPLSERAAAPARTSTQVRAGLSALCVGTALLYVVGFMPIAAVHNAAHDTRHTAAFPCH